MACAWARIWPTAGLLAAAVFAAGLVTITPPAVAQTSGHLRHAARSCAHAGTPAVAIPVSELRAAVVCLVNQKRAAHHLPALQASRRLDRSAQDWTNEMVNTGDFSHGSNFSARITAVGFNWSAAAENIASGFPTPRSVVNAWMGSTGHCQNILSPSYSDVGTGVSRRAVRGAGGGAATWTQDFAQPMGQSAPSNYWGPANRCPY